MNTALPTNRPESDAGAPVGQVEVAIHGVLHEHLEAALVGVDLALKTANREDDVEVGLRGIVLVMTESVLVVLSECLS